ncbi:hypothetical protein VCHA29O37_630010 [Vibrio chagasii]|nr:hypothetical protein VCHA29O37_630010 [Vibrio chagasii]
MTLHIESSHIARIRRLFKRLCHTSAVLLSLFVICKLGKVRNTFFVQISFNLGLTPYVKFYTWHFSQKVLASSDLPQTLLEQILYSFWGRAFSLLNLIR